MTLTYASTFTGIGGFDKAWDDLGMQCTLQVEIDANRRRVLTEQFPDVPRKEDICDVDGTELGNPDILVGGFPCKDLSISTGDNRKGLDGSRSGLVWEWLRLAEEHLRLVDAARPRWAILENVPGLVNYVSPDGGRPTSASNGGRDMAAVLLGLEELGYGWAYRVVDGRRQVGSPQRRPRTVIVGHRGGDPRPAWLVLADTPGRLGDLQVRAEQAIADRSDARRATIEAGTRIFRKSARPTGKAPDGAYANYKEDGFINVLNNNDSRSNPRQTHLVSQGGRLRALTPMEWERAQGFPDNWTLGMLAGKGTTPERERMEALGDAMNVGLAGWLGRNLIEVDQQVPLIGDRMMTRSSSGS